MPPPLEIKTYVERLGSDDTATKREAADRLRERAGRDCEEIIKHGGIEELINLTCNAISRSVVTSAAAEALWRLAENGAASKIVEDGGIQALVNQALGILDSRRCDSCAAGALGSLAENSAYSEEIVKAGGVKALIELTKRGDPDVGWTAATALSKLARFPVPAEAIKEAGGIGALVALTRCEWPAERAAAAEALERLAEKGASSKIIEAGGGIQALVDLTNGRLPQAARTLGHLAENGAWSDEIVKAGGVKALVGLARVALTPFGGDHFGWSAAMALSKLARFPGPAEAIKEAGGIGALVALTRCQWPYEREFAAWALGYLADHGLAYCTAIKEADGDSVDALNKLAGYGDGQAKAAKYALATLSADWGAAEAGMEAGSEAEAEAAAQAEAPAAEQAAPEAAAEKAAAEAAAAEAAAEASHDNDTQTPPPPPQPTPAQGKKRPRRSHSRKEAAVKNSCGSVSSPREKAVEYELVESVRSRREKAVEDVLVEYGLFGFGADKFGDRSIPGSIKCDDGRHLVSGRQFPLDRDYGSCLYRDYHDAEQPHTIELKDVRNWEAAVGQLAEYCELEKTQSGRMPRGTIVLFGSGRGFYVKDAEYDVVTQGDAKIINKVVEDKYGFQLYFLRHDHITAAAALADVATTEDVVFKALERAEADVASKRARDESGNAHTRTD